MLMVKVPCVAILALMPSGQVHLRAGSWLECNVWL